VKPSGGGSKRRSLKTLPLHESLTGENGAWFFHRIASSQKYSSGLHEIMYQWTLIDCLDAHLVLDAFLDIESQAPDDRGPEDDRVIRFVR
jgi:hypothetical protein